jgi:hypothetical protein
MRLLCSSLPRSWMTISIWSYYEPAISRSYNCTEETLGPAAARISNRCAGNGWRITVESLGVWGTKISAAINGTIYSAITKRFATTRSFVIYLSLSRTGRWRSTKGLPSNLLKEVYCVIQDVVGDHSRFPARKLLLPTAFDQIPALAPAPGSPRQHFSPILQISASSLHSPMQK